MLGAAPPGEPGVPVRDVVRGSPAERSGLRRGDVILRIDGQPVQRPADVVSNVGRRRAGERVNVAFLRGGAQRILAVSLARLPDDDEMVRMHYVGIPAPDFLSLSAVKGTGFSNVGQLRGKVAVVEFWAPWCAVCRYLVPTLNEWAVHYGPQGVEVIGVTTEPVRAAARAAAQLGIVYSVASDESGSTHIAYGAMALPTLFVIDKQGKVRDVMVGYSSRRLADLRGLLDRLVKSN
jgi:thiol-disulfide isomerase/thioredoxin